MDGGGFGLDNNVSHSVMQYNLAYGNDGAGFLAYSAVANAAHTDNTLRYNISHNDSRKLQEYGGMVALVRGSRTGVERPERGDDHRRAGRFARPRCGSQPSLGSVTVRNNVFVTDGSPVVASQSAFARSAVLLQGNGLPQWAELEPPVGGQLVLRHGSLAPGDGPGTLGPRATGTDQDPCLARVPQPAAGPNLRGTGPTQGALAARCARG